MSAHGVRSSQSAIAKIAKPSYLMGGQSSASAGTDKAQTRLSPRAAGPDPTAAPPARPRRHGSEAASCNGGGGKLRGAAMVRSECRRELLSSPQGTCPTPCPPCSLTPRLPPSLTTPYSPGSPSLPRPSLLSSPSFIMFSLLPGNNDPFHFNKHSPGVLLPLKQHSSEVAQVGIPLCVGRCFTGWLMSGHCCPVAAVIHFQCQIILFR